jgi:hypothetical protein
VLYRHPTAIIRHLVYRLWNLIHLCLFRLCTCLLLRHFLHQLVVLPLLGWGRRLLR